MQTRKINRRLNSIVRDADPVASLGNVHEQAENDFHKLLHPREWDDHLDCKDSVWTSEQKTVAHGVGRRGAVMLGAAAGAVLLCGGLLLGSDLLGNPQGDSIARGDGIASEISASATTLSDAWPDGTSSPSASKVFDSPAALGAESQLVAIGLFQGLQRGRTEAFRDTGDERVSTVMILSDVTVHKGQVSSDLESSVYVEVAWGESTSGVDPSLIQALPAGTPVLIYAREAWVGNTSTNSVNYIKDPDAGRPEGQKLWAVTAAQALAVQTENRTVTWPAMNITLDGQLTDALPNGSLIAK